MKFSAAVVLAAAAGASATYSGNFTVTTEVVDVYVTYCPEATVITHGSQTYTVTEATHLTISDCPCTITKPVYTSSVVECHTCGSPSGAPTGAPHASNPVYQNTTLIPTAAPTVIPPVASTGGVTPTTHASAVPTAGAGKAAVLSGAGLAGIVGLAAFVL